MGTATDAMWRGEPDRLKKARASAREAKRGGKPLAAHSIMLSAYVTLLSKRLGAGKYLLYGFLGIWHARWLTNRHRDLNHNQLDVLLQFYLKVRLLTPEVLPLARRAVELAQAANARPHQLALVYLTAAEVTYRIDFNRDTIGRYLEMALDLTSAIREEEDQPLGLRQLVRVHRKTGELLTTRELWDPMGAFHHLQVALALAKGEADAADQIPKIEAALKRLRDEKESPAR